MRNILQNDDPTKNTVATSKAAALVSFIFVLPLAILESLNNPVTRQNAPGLIVLFGLLWVLPIAFIVLLVPVVRTVREGSSITVNRGNLLLRVALSALIATIWVAIIVDQFPCFMGVANCD